MKLESGKEIPSPSNEIRNSLTAQPTSSVIRPFSAIELFPYTRLIFKEDGRTLVDMSPIEAAINEILNSSHASPVMPGIKLTFMQQLNYGFAVFDNEFKPKEPITVTNKLDQHVLLKYHEKFMLVLAKILMICDQFATLDFNDKLYLFKNSWHIFYLIERHYTSIEYFGRAKEDLRVFINDQIAVDYNDDNEFHIKGVNQKLFNRNRQLWLPFRDKFVKNLIIPMKDLQITQYELAFLLSHILWNVQNSEGLSEETIKIAKQVTEQTAMELHNYFFVFLFA
uniref:NR LBD domain-containing protein n=1 Tax=Acrobeloides nanus TaxID=290746 RepID=A0A914CAJ0_9BILA